MAAKNSEATADQEFISSRVFDAPLELMWEAWTDPKQLARWWGRAENRK